MSDHDDILVVQDLVRKEFQVLDENRRGTCWGEGDGAWALLDGSLDGSVIRVDLGDSLIGKDRGDLVGHEGDVVASGVDCDEVDC